MPKVSLSTLPVSALFGVTKPSGPSSMAIINDIKRLVSSSRLFVDEETAKENAERLASSSSSKGEQQRGKWSRSRGRRKAGRAAEAKMGQGGTLDPLADGVLVVGVNKGTKRLGEFLDCVKEYRATCLLGCETDSYDSEGAQVRTAPWKHVTRESVESALEKFRGQIKQTPPIFSALKMNGMPLYEYARSGTPLPRAIERRDVTVHSLELTHWLPGTEHSYKFPEKKFTEEERQKMAKAMRGVETAAGTEIKDEPEQSKSPEEENEVESDDRPAAFVISMRVSGGTYVRSLAHDIGHAVGSAAHVVTLTRSRQGRFALPTQAPMTTPSPEETSLGDNDVGEDERTCIPWDVFTRALDHTSNEEPDEEGWKLWEREIIEAMELVEGRAGD